MINKSMVKKAQIGATLSWFVATLIIFFIIVLFLSASIIFSSKKIVSGGDKINLEKKANELTSFEVLLGFLDKKIIFDNEKTNIKNILVKGLDQEKRTNVKEKLKGEMDKITKENFIGNSCYLFDIEYPNSNLNVGNGFDVCSLTCTDERFDEYVDQYKTRLLSKSISFDIYSEKGVIKTKFYLGEC